MTNKEARNILLTSIHPQTAEEAEAIGIAIKAVERMIPKKLKKIPKELYLGSGEVNVLCCPNCGIYIGVYDDNNEVKRIDWNKTIISEYCPYCVQKIDWSE